MENALKRTSPPGLRVGKRVAVTFDGDGAAQNLTTSSAFHPDSLLPLVIQPTVSGVHLKKWAASHPEVIENGLLRHGAVLFRGFRNPVPELEELIRVVAGEALEYQDQSSPRSKINGNIYTSTDYPADQAIPLHNENSYSHAFPRKLFFACVHPAQHGGETPLADSRRIYRRLPESIRARFTEKQVLYVRNFGEGIGLDWRRVFQTEKRADVEDYCARNQIACEWRGNNRLRTRQVRPAVARHTQTGEMVWFNHALFFHVQTLSPTIREVLLRDFAVEDLPTNTYYGDGSEIEPEVLEHLRAAYRQETISFPWQEGDILLVDNMLTAHGRAPYQGPRKIIIGMAQIETNRQL